MHPRTFLDVVARPNVEEATERGNDWRLAVNAILALDALMGVLHAYNFRLENPLGAEPLVQPKGDEKFKAALSREYPSIRIVRDAAAALKHGELRTDQYRLIVHPASMVCVENTLGTFAVDDEMDGDIVAFMIPGEEVIPRSDEVVMGALRILELMTPPISTAD